MNVLKQKRVEKKTNQFVINNKPSTVNKINTNQSIQNNINNVPIKYNISKPIVKTNHSETIVSGIVRSKDNPEKGELHQFRIKKEVAEMPNFDDFCIKPKKQVDQLDIITSNMFVNTIKNNKLTDGTKIMLDNDLHHAKEAIESGIYITWTSKTVVNVNLAKWKGYRMFQNRFKLCLYMQTWIQLT